MECVVKTILFCSQNTPMTQIDQQQRIITYHIPGTAAEYTAHLKAIVKALTSKDLNEDERHILGGLAIEMLPNEHQVNVNHQ